MRSPLNLILFILLLLCFAYYWLDLLVHSIAGLLFLVLITTHLTLKRRWFLRRNRTMGDKVTIALLLGFYVVLIVTSMQLSDFGDGGYKAKQWHVFAASWVLMFVSVHLGFKLSKPKSPVLLPFLPLGILGFYKLKLLEKLTCQRSLEWWDFNESVALFFVYLFSVSVGIIVVTQFIRSLFVVRPETTSDL